MKLKTQISTASNHSVLLSATLGIVCAVIISLLFVTGLTSFVIGGKIGENSLHTIVFIVRTIAVLTGALVGTALAKEKCVITVGVIVAGYLVLLLGLGIVIYDESFENFGSGFVSAIIGGIVGCLIRLKSQNKPRRTRKIKA